MDSDELVDYRLLRQRQQEERFKARGATWKPSGKACTLQFVFEEDPKRPIEAKGKIQSIGARPEVSKVEKHVTTSVFAQSRMAGQPSQSTGKSQRIKPVALDAALSLRSDEERLEQPSPSPVAPPSRPRKPKAQDHPPTKKTRAKDGRSANQIAETVVTIALPIPGLDGGQGSTSKLTQERKKKETVKTSSDLPLSTPDSSGPGKEVTTVPSTKPRRPKKGEQTVETKGRPEDTESKYCRPKKRANPVIHDEDSGEDIDLSQNSHIPTAKVTVTSVRDLANAMVHADDPVRLSKDDNSFRPSPGGGQIRMKLNVDSSITGDQENVQDTMIPPLV